MITFDQLPEAVWELQTEVREIRRLLSENKPTEENRLLVLTEAAEFLNLSRPSIYRLVSRRQIPYHKSGGKLYFFESELREWIKTGRKSLTP